MNASYKLNVALHALTAHVKAQELLGSSMQHAPQALNYGISQQIDEKANYWVQSGEVLLQVRCSCGRLFWEKPDMDAEEQQIVTLVEIARIQAKTPHHSAERLGDYKPIRDKS